jgi:alpha-tubulin suppressor-like RCC1 family protein
MASTGWVCDLVGAQRFGVEMPLFLRDLLDCAATGHASTPASRTPEPLGDRACHAAGGFVPMTRQRWLLAWSLIGAVVLVGCGDNTPTEPVDVPPPGPVSLDGLWDFTEVLIISSQVVVCRDTGSFRLVQDGDQFGGTGDLTGSCTGLLGSFGNHGPFVIEGGTIEDSTFTFSIADGCSYAGTVSEGFPRRLRGSSGCSVNYDGSWEAAEGAVVSSIVIDPDSLEMVVGESVSLTAVLRDVMGARLFQRAVTWRSTDPAVVSVGESGDVLARGVGAAVLSGSVEGLLGQASVATELVTFNAMGPGVFHTCALSVDGTAYCWGRSHQGQVGPARTTGRCDRFPCRLAPGAVTRQMTFTKVDAGFASTCGLATDGLAYCWGANATGQLGDGSANASPTPVPVTGGTRFSSLSVGSEHACALAANGSAFCWGNNASGQLGIGPAAESFVPTPVAGGLRFAAISGGGIHTCGVTGAGRVYCWGDNFGGQLGVDLATRRSLSPVAVETNVNFTLISTGGLHTCGISNTGRTLCWGENTDRQLGVDSLDFSPQPLEPAPGPAFVAVSAGGFHSCALTVDGVAWCWGEGESGQLGDGGTEDRATPVQVAGGLAFQSVTAGAFHTCGHGVDGILYCWGSNADGQVGAPMAAAVPTPMAVIGQPRG